MRAAGTRLGPYEIVAPLGAGGMGEVYKARDTRIGRAVAIKVLPAEVENDPDRRRRFHQEAVAAGALNHPNLLIVHDVGAEGGLPFLVTELLNGETLRDRLQRGPVPQATALRYASALLDGLAAAHAAGIVHRDIKPENIFVTDDDVPKLLDFGLARMPGGWSGADGGGATVTTPGTILGSVGYMAPEQVTGAAVDHRADLFAIGVVLYEMLAGQTPFRGASAVETLNDIVMREPVFPPSIASPLRAVLQRSLQKSPGRRFQSAADFAFALRMIGDGEAVEPARRRRLPALLAVLAIAASGVAAGAAIGWRAAAPRTQPFPNQRRITFQQGRVWSARFVPNSDTIVYAASWNDQPIRLFSAHTGFPAPTALDLPPSDLLSISSAGELAILMGRRSLQGMEPSAGTLARAPIAGGAPRELVERAIDADWTPDGELAAVRDVGPVRRLEFPVGHGVYETAGWIDTVRVSRDGARVAFADHPFRTDDMGDLAVAERSGAVTRVAQHLGAVRGIAWGPDDRQIWMSNEGRVETFGLDGSHHVAYRDPRGFRLLDVATDGRMLIVVDQRRASMSGRLAGDAAERDLSWFEYSVAADISRDGRAVLFFEAGEAVVGDEYLIGLWQSGIAQPLKLGMGRPTSLSNDGRLALAIKMKGTPGLRVLPIGPGDTREIDFPSLAAIQWATWLPDGRRFVLSANEAGHSSRLYVADLDGRLLRTIGPEGTFYQANAVSPDGSHVAAKDPRGGLTIYGVTDDTSAQARGLLRDELPIGWSSNGAEIFVMAPGVPARVTRLDPVSGARTPWRDLIASDAAGIVRISPILIAPDGESYAYTSGRFLSTLYAVGGR